ncbi:MAG: flavodoxin family protein [Spirochaetota bacterium]
MSCLVTYYSRSGRTARLGRAIADALRADVQEIVSKRKFRGPWGFVAGAFQAARGKTPKLEPLARDPGDYQVVLIGTPVWASTMASPVRSFLAQNGKSIQKTAFFLTLGGTNPGRTFQEMERLTECKPLATVTLRSREVKKATVEQLQEAAGSLIQAVQSADR